MGAVFRTKSQENNNNVEEKGGEAEIVHQSRGVCYLNYKKGEISSSEKKKRREVRARQGEKEL